MAEATMSAEVTQTVGQLQVTVPGADTACNADCVAGLSLTVGDWVTITVRTPQRPLVTAIEIEA